jgi:hypothetical protein
MYSRTFSHSISLRTPESTPCSASPPENADSHSYSLYLLTKTALDLCPESSNDRARYQRLTPRYSTGVRGVRNYLQP